jgi:adenylate cyclase
MYAPGPSDVFLFEDFRLDRRGLFRREQGDVLVQVKVGSRALGVLSMLIERAGELVLKEEIVAAVWPGRVIEDSNLTVQISALRNALDHGQTEGNCIQTVAGRGYRFITSVTRCAADMGHGAPADSRVYALAADALAALPRAEMPAASRPTTPRYERRHIATAVVVGVLIIAGGLSWLRPSLMVPSAAPRLSIVVLPFTNLSDDREQQYFADGVTDDLTTDLSRITDSFVISRNTAFTFKDKPVNAKQIGRELGVRYVLEGSVQRSGKQIRVNAQLIDAESDAHVWTERLERDIGDLSALQNEITSRIAIAFNLALIGAEAARPSNNPDALDYILRGRAVGLKPLSRDTLVEQIGLFERALAFDPHSAEAQSYLALALASRVLSNNSASAATDIERAEGFAEKALASSPLSPLAHLAKAQVFRARRRWPEAMPEYETVLASNRNVGVALFGLGQCKLMTGSIEETIPLLEQAIRLSPLDPGISIYYWQIGRTDLLQSRTDQAVVWLEKARNANPAQSLFHGELASAYALKGETERAAAELAEARRLGADGRYASIARLRAVARDNFGVPKIRVLFEATYFAGLRKAGMPAE